MSRLIPNYSSATFSKEPKTLKTAEGGKEYTPYNSMTFMEGSPFGNPSGRGEYYPRKKKKQN